MFFSQAKYKEQFIKDMKNHSFNPLESASFKQAQIASALASNVSWVVLAQLQETLVSLAFLHCYCSVRVTLLLLAFA